MIETITNPQKKLMPKEIERRTYNSLTLLLDFLTDGTQLPNSKINKLISIFRKRLEKNHILWLIDRSRGRSEITFSPGDEHNRTKPSIYLSEDFYKRVECNVYEQMSNLVFAASFALDFFRAQSLNAEEKEQFENQAGRRAIAYEAEFLLTLQKRVAYPTEKPFKMTDTQKQVLTFFPHGLKSLH